MPPFLLRNRKGWYIRHWVIADSHDVGGSDGLIVMTAGSLAEGTGLEHKRELRQVVG